MVYHYLALQNYKLFCKEIAEEHEELTGSGGHHVGALSAECLVGTTANGWAI